MKKSFILLIILAFAFTTASSQFTGTGTGLAFTTGFKFHNADYDYNKSGKIAVSLKGVYEITPQISISPSFTIFYPNITEVISREITVSSMMVDINGHYVFLSSGNFDLYGIAGLDILLAWKKEKYSESDNFRESDNALGLNTGAGVRFNITENLDLFGEIKYIISKYDQIMVNAGILINPEWFKKSNH